MRGRSGLIVACLLAGLLAGPVSSGSASSYSGASILSIAPDAQFDQADSAVVSADGQYVVFRGTVDGHAGLWRRSVLSGALVPVAIDLPGVIATQDPQAPSVSADGRFVAFDTRAALDPVNDTNNVWDVYVRDMSLPTGAPGAFTLASAVNGATQGLQYTPYVPSLDGAHLAGWQSQAGQPNPASAPGGAISADGTKVVFSVDTQSNLVNSATADTPPGQVAVRDLATDTTQLVSAQSAGPKGASPPPSCAGAAYPAVCWVDIDSSQYGAVSQNDAVISADGSTVGYLAPLGAIEQEAAVLPGEDTLAGTSSLSSGLDDIQAVWRRVADGPLAPSLRLTGATDPYAPGCSLRTQVQTGGIPAACAGPLNVAAGSFFSHLVLSADGYSAVLLATAQLVGATNIGQAQAYLVNMHPGLTRDQATRALTQGASTSTGPAPGEAAVVGDAISADAATVLLATARSRFDLTSPRYVGPSRSAPSAGNELFAINLRQDIMDLVTVGYDGSPADYATCGNFGGTFSPSVSADGAVIGFDSCSDNLVFGDGNGASDVFSETALGGTPAGAPTQLPGTLPPVTLPTPWRLRITTRALRGGAIELDVVVPAAGRLSAGASAKLRISHRPRARSASRSVAQAHARAASAGLVVLRLVLSPRLRAQLGATGLNALVHLSFAPRRGSVLHATLALKFLAPSRPRRPRRPHHRRGAK